MGSYPESDICFLLKELNGDIEETNFLERERLIQQGTHYSELLPMEYNPSEEYMKLFHLSLEKDKYKVASYVGNTAEKILLARGEKVVLVSLARAGSPVGVLLKRYLKQIHRLDIPHYSISIIRGKGFDQRAISYLLQNYDDKQLLFVDGWTGKGAIGKQLIEACDNYNKIHSSELIPDLAVIADPACSARIWGTRDDFLIPSACLNSTVSGLVSRTFHRTDIISEKDYHGARFYRHLEDRDVSNLYINTISRCFTKEHIFGEIVSELQWTGWDTVLKLSKIFDIANLNHIKPGVGETTRVLLRRVPWKILIRDDRSAELSHIIRLAEERGVPLEVFNDMEYSCCGLIKTIGKGL